MAFKEKTSLTPAISDSLFGTSVSVYGYYAAIGAPNQNDCFIYRRGTDDQWTLLSTIDESSGNFGYCVELYKNDLMISQPDDGYVYIYNSSDNFASPIVTLSESGSVSYGSSISLSENYAIIGDPAHDSNKGRVFVYEKQNDGWAGVSTGTEIVPDDILSNEYFGSSVAINDNFAIIGCRGREDNRGSVYIFEKNSETGLWEQTLEIRASDGESGDRFGCSVSLSGDYLAIGADNANIGDYYYAGAVYIFRKGNEWYEIEKINSVSESDISSDYFGRDIELRDDYLIVGSPNENGSGTAYVFSKKRNWGLLANITPSDVSTGDNFGASVSISYPFLVSGSPNAGAGDNDGKAYVFEDPQIHFRLAQEFDVDGDFLPSKVSLYLRRCGKNEYNYWLLSNNFYTVIDATNFSDIQQSDNKIILSDEMSSYTGNGYVFVEREDTPNYGVIEYPIKSSEADNMYYFYFRVLSTQSSSFNMEILLDNNVVKTMSETISDPSSNEWSWIGTSIVIPDTNSHTLGIKMKGSGHCLDKIYIDTIETEPFAQGPNNSSSPYVTIHLQVYHSDGLPTEPLFIYDYKNTITDVVTSDWYNFNIKILDSYHGFTQKEDFTGSYYLVLSSSGTNLDNFILWEWENNDEYSVSPSAFMF